MFTPSAATSAPSDSHPQSPGASVFYRYRSADGRIVIVDSLERIPKADRGRAERVEMQAPEASRFPVISNVAAGMDWPSFATGFGLALGIAVVLSFVSRGSSRILGMLVLAALLIGGGGAYFGWLHRTAGGQGDSTFATPQTLIEDAQRAVDKLKQHEKDQDKVIEDAQREAK